MKQLAASAEKKTTGVKKKVAPAKRKAANAPKKSRTPVKKKTKNWSAGVTEHSNALDLESSVFKLRDPHKIAASLKRSAEKSTRRKGTPLQSAMSMLNFYINRAGKNLGATQKNH